MSDYQDDRSILDHFRFKTFNEYFRLRRGDKMEIKIPLYPDVNTEMHKILEHEKFAGHIH